MVVHSMDRPPRDLDNPSALIQGLTRKGVRVDLIKESLVFTGEESPMANPVFSVMGTFAEFERFLIRASQREGIPLPSNAAPTKDGRRPAGRNGRPSGSSAPAAVFRRPSFPAGPHRPIDKVTDRVIQTIASLHKMVV